MEGLIQVRMPETKLIDNELSFLLSTRLFILSRPINQNGTVISMADFFFYVLANTGNRNIMSKVIIH